MLYTHTVINSYIGIPIEKITWGIRPACLYTRIDAPRVFSYCNVHNMVIPIEKNTWGIQPACLGSPIYEITILGTLQ